MSRPIALAAAFLLGLVTLVHGQAAGGIKAYSKYDFVPGEKVMLFDDFASDEVGDFPAGWDTNASGEVVTLECKPGRWLAFTKGGVFLPVLRGDLPEVFTLEFDVLASQPFNYGTSLAVILAAMGDLKQLVSWHGTDNRFTFTLNPGGASSADRGRDGEGEAAVQVQFEPFAATGGAPVHVSVWRQKERVRVYIGGQKVWDLPKGIVSTAKLNALMFYLLLRRVLGRGGPPAERPEPAIVLGAAAGALLFALHPLRVETVAWVSDRKDLLCAFFLLPMMFCYLESGARARVTRGSARRTSTPPRAGSPRSSRTSPPAGRWNGPYRCRRRTTGKSSSTRTTRCWSLSRRARSSWTSTTRPVRSTAVPAKHSSATA